MAAKKKPAPKRGASRYQAPAKKPVPGWVWLAAGLTIGAFVVFLMKLEPGRDNIKREKADAAAAATLKREEQAKLPPAPLAPVKPKYDFYTLLPGTEAVVPTDAVPEKAQTPVTPAEAAKIDTARAQAALSGQVPPPPPPVKTAASQAATPATAAATAPPTTQFFLQAGSFRKQDDADRVRAQIIILGQSARVESGKVKDDTWYRVMVGPFSNREQLTVAQKQLATSGYANLLLQQRQAPSPTR